MEKKKNTIVVVNSYKGGAGKTSMSLSYCVTRARNNLKENSKEKVFFVDIDLQGTGSQYILLEKEAKVKRYLNTLEHMNVSNKLDDYSHAIKISEKDFGDYEIYGIMSNPVTDFCFQEGSGFRDNRAVEEGSYRNKIINILKEIIDNGCDNYIVVDCSPGVSRMEREILSMIYQEIANGNSGIKIEEIYITTFDDRHIEKTIRNLSNDIRSLGDRVERSIKVVLNDVHNIPAFNAHESEMDDSPEAFSFQLTYDDAEREVMERLDEIEGLEVYHREYNLEMAAGNMHKNTKYLFNKPDNYILTETNYKKYEASDGKNSK